MGNDLDDICQRPRLPRLGLPQPSVVEFPDDDQPERGLHWKTAFLNRWASRRTFAWLGDEITDADQHGFKPTTQGGHCCTKSTRSSASPMPTSLWYINGWQRDSTS